MSLAHDVCSLVELRLTALGYLLLLLQHPGALVTQALGLLKHASHALQILLLKLHAFLSEQVARSGSQGRGRAYPRCEKHRLLRVERVEFAQPLEDAMLLQCLQEFVFRVIASVLNKRSSEGIDARLFVVRESPPLLQRRERAWGSGGGGEGSVGVGWC